MKALLLIEHENKLEFKWIPITHLDRELEKHPNASCFFPNSSFQEWNKVLEIGISNPKKEVYLNETNVRLSIDDFLDRNVGFFQSFLEKLDDPEKRNTILTQVCIFFIQYSEYSLNWNKVGECTLRVDDRIFEFEWKRELGDIPDILKCRRKEELKTKIIEGTKKDSDEPKKEVTGPTDLPAGPSGPLCPEFCGPEEWKDWISESFGESDNQRLVFQEGASFYYLIRPTEIKYRILQAGEIRMEDSWPKTSVTSVTPLVPQKVTSFIKTEFGTMLRLLKIEISQPSDSYAQVRISPKTAKITAKPIAKPIRPSVRPSVRPSAKLSMKTSARSTTCGAATLVEEHPSSVSQEGTSEFFKDLKKRKIVPAKHEAVVLKISSEAVKFSGNGENRVFPISSLRNPNDLQKEIWENARVVDNPLDPTIKWIWRDEPSDWSLQDIYPRVRGKDFTVVIASPLHPEKRTMTLIQCDDRVFVCNCPCDCHEIWETLDTMFPGRETQNIGVETQVSYKIPQKCREIMTQMNESGVTNEQLTSRSMGLIHSNLGVRLIFGAFDHPVPKDTTLQEFQCIAELMDGPFRYLPRHIPGGAYNVNELTFEVDVFHSDPNAWHFDGLTRVRTQKTEDQLTFVLTPDSGTMSDIEMEVMTRMLQQQYLDQAWVHAEVLSRKSKTYRLVFARMQGNSLI